MNPYIVLRFRTDHNRDFSYRVSNADKDVEQHDVLAAVSDLLGGHGGIAFFVSGSRISRGQRGLRPR